MQTISFLLFRLLAFVVKNHLKREKNSKKKSFFPFTTTPSPGYPPDPDPDPDPHEDFCPDPDPDPQKKNADPKPCFLFLFVYTYKYIYIGLFSLKHTDPGFCLWPSVGPTPTDPRCPARKLVLRPRKIRRIIT